MGPSIGEDAAIIDLGDGKALVAHVDPVTGVVEYLGWLAVHIASNDVAVRGLGHAGFSRSSTCQKTLQRIS